MRAIFGRETDLHLCSFFGVAGVSTLGGRAGTVLALSVHDLTPTLLALHLVFHDSSIRYQLFFCKPLSYPSRAKARYQAWLVHIDKYSFVRSFLKYSVQLDQGCLLIQTQNFILGFISLLGLRASHGFGMLPDTRENSILDARKDTSCSDIPPHNPNLLEHRQLRQSDRTACQPCSA